MIWWTSEAATDYVKVVISQGHNVYSKSGKNSKEIGEKSASFDNASAPEHVITKDTVYLLWIIKLFIC